MNDKTLVEMLAGWSDSEFAVVASGEYCEDLKSRIEGVLAKQDDTIEALQSRIEALEAASREAVALTRGIEAAKAERDRLRQKIEELEAENAEAGRNVYLLQTQNARFSALLKEAVTTSVRCTLNEQWLKSAKQALESKQ